MKDAGREQVFRYGASDFIRKPFDINDVASSVCVILDPEIRKNLAESFACFVVMKRDVIVSPSTESIINAMSYNLTKYLVPSGLCNSTTAENIPWRYRRSSATPCITAALKFPVIHQGGVRDKRLQRRNRETES